MRPDLELTSVPRWALTPTRPDADLSGRAWTVITFGSRGADIAKSWAAQIASSGRESAMRLHRIDEEDPAGSDTARRVSAVLRSDLADARVGWRLMMAGPADACLGLRGMAMALGVADDEMTVASTDVDSRAVQCVHCAAVTRAPVQLGETLPCSSCARNLLVYHHVSRSSGAYMGFMVDAEEQSATGLSS
jgi:dimethylamine monooxygenase subunit C